MARHFKCIKKKKKKKRLSFFILWIMVHLYLKEKIKKSYSFIIIKKILLGFLLFKRNWKPEMWGPVVWVKKKKKKTRENCLNSCRNVSVLCDDYGDVSFFFCFFMGWTAGCVEFPSSSFFLFYFKEKIKNKRKMNETKEKENRMVNYIWW